MARIRNSSVYSEDRNYLQALADELEWLGRGRWVDLNLKEGRLTQRVFPPHRAKGKTRADRKTARRDS